MGNSNLALWVARALSTLLVLFTGVFGGAIASRARIGDPLFSHVLFGAYLGLFAWGGLWLRDPSLRAVFPVRPAAIRPSPPPPLPR